jgi:hypothetical protein
MGLPWISAKGLPGKRDDFILAGITPNTLEIAILTGTPQEQEKFELRQNC